MYQPASLTPVEAQEIVRCTALAIRRRGELLGPLAAHDTVLDNVIAALHARAGPPNHWSEAWLDLQLGLALSARDVPPRPFRSCKRRLWLQASSSIR